MEDEPKEQGSSESRGWVMHLPGKDGEAGGGGYITQEDYEDHLREPRVAARLKRVHEKAEKRRKLGGRVASLPSKSVL